MSSGTTQRPGTALVTGGAGFIGSATSPPPLAPVARVVAVDNLHPQIHPPVRDRPALDRASSWWSAT